MRCSYAYVAAIGEFSDWWQGIADAWHANGDRAAKVGSDLLVRIRRLGLD